MPSLTPEARALEQLFRHLNAVSENDLRIREFWIPQTHGRADLAVVGDQMCGFEIKTAPDNLKRLPAQIKAYNSVFDQCTLVVAEKHRVAAMELLPEWWGILLLPEADDHELTEIRPVRPNPVVDPETLIRLLWKREAEATLNHLCVSYDETSSRFRLWRAILDASPPGLVRDHVREAILTRDVSKARIPTQRFRPRPAALA